jgi:phosphoribosylformimino-5-aminoimidazole carboxamide ribotide isomerase
MIIYPAIDLINGRCVRLHKGRFDEQVVYDTPPDDVAKSYADAGASWVHLVDLDGARDPEKRQRDTIARLISVSGLNVQTGGGVRSLEDAAAILETGAARVVIGSLAVKNPNVVKACFDKFGPDKICLAIDVVPDDENPDAFRVAVSGWQETSATELSDILKSYSQDGLRHVLCTDISRDGTMSGCNLDLYKKIKSQFPAIEIQASGGVKSLDDLRRLVEIGAEGAIVGKALYEGVFTVREALAIC